MSNLTAHKAAGALVGVDVGTTSARAGIFTADGRLLATARRPITIWREAGDIVEQSADQIWQAVTASVREAVAAAGLLPADISGIGFDATCSLVALDADGQPATVSPSGVAERNIIVWMDHRAVAEAEEINRGNHAVLDYVGGRISPEMETPKLLWLKRHLPQAFAAAAHFMDLSDFLTWRATGSLERSTCTVTCKWTYLAHEQRWDGEYFRAIGLGELAEDGFARIGTRVVAPGTALGQGLTASAAGELGLSPGTAVAAALIDAHAGGVGTLGADIGGTGEGAGFGSRLAYIFGTSACSMASADGRIFVPGVWGPYFSAMVPGLWLTEGGQSAAGAALDHLVLLHPAATGAKTKAAEENLSLVEWLGRQAESRIASSQEAIRLAGGVHVVPEFLGNRSPFADPEARAIIAGLGLEDDLESLIGLYIAGLAGIGYGLRQLLDRLRESGISISTIMASGGAARSRLVCQVLADATGTTVAVADTSEPVLLGAAMLGAVASGQQPDLATAMRELSGSARLHEPSRGEIGQLHLRRYGAFSSLQQAARKVRDSQ
ncbi:FGGY-family carbohydrate kinase [Radicibacter daui]|uniref:FGGY-family carbohydrate kinase n=1 Tax=Radicibacter daui TaxID=3064829 RepID=UPI004046F987